MCREFALDITNSPILNCYSFPHFKMLNQNWAIGNMTSNDFSIQIIPQLDSIINNLMNTVPSPIVYQCISFV